ncbi:MAG TPA: hypothetical protein VNT77_04130 [Allosphingosinicella sp.]|nr:hypothetical protein [Allosphingosinicella sp.]
MMLRLPLALLLFAAPAAAEEAKFEPSAESFADAAACRAHLQGIVVAATGYEHVRGPYDIAAGDVRIHMVRAEGSGHRIWEHRCLDQQLSARSWHHSMEADEEEFTVESVVAKADWLKKGAPQQ